MKVTLLAFLLTTALMQSCDQPLPPDSVLEENFQRHEADFNRLLKMAENDSNVMRIAPDFTWLVDDASWPRPKERLGFTEQRWSEYRQLFARLKLEKGLLRYQDVGITYFFSSSKGLVTGGSGKGYAYSTKELSPLSNSLDSVPAKLVLDSPNHTVYKKIQANWYLFYDSN